MDELAESSGIGLVRAPHRRNLIAAERQLQIGILRNNPCERNSQVETQGDIFFFGILKRKDLFGVFFAITHQRYPEFLRRRIEWLKAVPFIHRADGRDHLEARIHLCRKIVTKAAKQSWLNNFLVGHTWDS